MYIKDKIKWDFNFKSQLSHLYECIKINPILNGNQSENSMYFEIRIIFDDKRSLILNLNNLKSVQDKRSLKGESKSIKFSIWN